MGTGPSTSLPSGATGPLAGACGGSLLSRLGDVLELVLEVATSSVCTTASLVLRCGVPVGLSSGDEPLRGRAVAGSVLRRMWGTSSSLMRRQVVPGAATLGSGLASPSLPRRVPLAWVVGTGTALSGLRDTLMCGRDAYRLTVSGRPGLARTGRREGLSELVRLGARGVRPGLAGGALCAARGCLGDTRSSSQREEQRKTAGSAGRPRRGEAAWEVEAVESADDSSDLRRRRRPGDSLMKVSCLLKPERSEDSLPLERAEATRTRPRRLPRAPGVPSAPARPLELGSGDGLASGGGTRLAGLCMNGIRTGDFWVLCCLARRARAGDLGTGEPPGPGRGPPVGVARGDRLGRGWDAGDVCEELEDGVLAKRAGGVALLGGRLRDASSEILPGLWRLRERCCSGLGALVAVSG